MGGNGFYQFYHFGFKAQISLKKRNRMRGFEFFQGAFQFLP